MFCYYLVHLVWKLNKNPDNICIPLLTATGDFLGVSMLFLCFHLAYLAGNTSLKTDKLPILLTTLNNLNATDLLLSNSTTQATIT